MDATCQSCGMPLGKDLQKDGTNADGTKSTRFCSLCYADGKFRHPNFTVQEMQQHCVEALRNKGVPRPLAWLLTRGIPRLERWRSTQDARLARARQRVVTMKQHRAAAAYLVGLVLLGLASPSSADERGFFGLLRARDLTPFGFLRLDMRPAHAVQAPAGNWAIETELAYQNTWALSPETEHYLESLPTRRELGPAELQAIRDLPGENYLFDVELAELDVTIHYKWAERWGAYLILSGVRYDGGFLDSSIESFHDTFGFSSFGRLAAARDDVNVIFDLKSAQVAAFEAPNDGGMLDPTIGIRYSGLGSMMGWDVVVEAAAKVPVSGQRELLSTGDTDYGLEATFQRFINNHAYYVSLSGVYYDGTNSITPTPPQVIPTLIVGWEWRMTTDTHLLLQGYASPSIYSHEETDLHELLVDKYQLSIGLYHRMGAGVVSFGITENFQNINNTPDIGLQLGWAYSPALRAP